jgi:hypothetical protein
MRDEPEQADRDDEGWEEPPIYGCPLLGHDCSEPRCRTKCRMSAFSWAEMDADRERNAPDPAR